MLRSNYPGGFGNGITIRDVPIIQSHPGKVFWVSNTSTLLQGQRGGSDGNKGNFDSPFATLSYAISQCTANRGDIIFIKPGHAETISTATALQLNIVNVAIIGLGTGTNRPTFTLDTANTVTIPVSANNISVQNCLFIANFLAIANIFTVTARHFTLDLCEFRDTSSVLCFSNVALCSSASANIADGLSITRCAFYGLYTSALRLVSSSGNNNRVNISDNIVFMAVNNNKSAILSVADGFIITNLVIARNKVRRLNTDTSTGALLFTSNMTTNTGMVYDNYIQHADVAAALVVTAGCGVGTMNNLATGDADTSGFVLPAIGAD